MFLHFIIWVVLNVTDSVFFLLAPDHIKCFLYFIIWVVLTDGDFVWLKWIVIIIFVWILNLVNWIISNLFYLVVLFVIFWCRDCGKQVYLGMNLYFWLINFIYVEVFIIFFFAIYGKFMKLVFGLVGGFDTAHAAAR